MIPGPGHEVEPSAIVLVANDSVEDHLKGCFKAEQVLPGLVDKSGRRFWTPAEKHSVLLDKPLSKCALDEPGNGVPMWLFVLTNPGACTKRGVGSRAGVEAASTAIELVDMHVDSPYLGQLFRGGSSREGLDFLHGRWDAGVDHFQETVDKCDGERSTFLVKLFLGRIDDPVDGVKVPVGKVRLKHLPQQTMDEVVETVTGGGLLSIDSGKIEVLPEAVISIHNAGKIKVLEEGITGSRVTLNIEVLEEGVAVIHDAGTLLLLECRVEQARSRYCGGSAGSVWRIAMLGGRLHRDSMLKE